MPEFEIKITTPVELSGAKALARIFHSWFDFDCGRIKNLKEAR
jgi:hypothetical protein